MGAPLERQSAPARHPQTAGRLPRSAGRLPRRPPRHLPRGGRLRRRRLRRRPLARRTARHAGRRRPRRGRLPHEPGATARNLRPCPLDRRERRRPADIGSSGATAPQPARQRLARAHPPRRARPAPLPPRLRRGHLRRDAPRPPWPHSEIAILNHGGTENIEKYREGTNGDYFAISTTTCLPPRGSYLNVASFAFTGISKTTPTSDFIARTVISSTEDRIRYVGERRVIPTPLGILHGRIECIVNWLASYRYSRLSDQSRRNGCHPSAC